MNEKALKIVNALIPSKLITEVVKSTQSSKKDVVNIAIELTNKITEKEDIDKQTLEHTIKTLVRSDVLLAFLEELNNKYNISKESSSKVLTVMLPSIYKNFLQIDDSLFIKEEKVVEEIKEVKQEQKVDPVPVDDVLKNIENKAKEEQAQEEPKTKKKLALFKKKEKEVVEKKEEEIEEKIEELPTQKSSLLNTICSIVVLISFIALLAIIIVLVIKQKTA